MKEFAIIKAMMIKASYKDCPISDRKLFNQSSCIMPISVPQLVHEGDKLKATMDLVNRTFKKCTILVDDTVQRHTLKITLPEYDEPSLYEMATNEGDLWIERNQSILNQLTIPCDIIRWERWLLHPKFNIQLDYISNLYNTHLEYKQSIDDTIVEYLTRTQKNGKVFDYDEATAICLEYLKEECASMLLWVEGGYDFEIYPTGRNKAMSATYKYLIEPKYPSLLKSVSLRFKKC